MAKAKAKLKKTQNPWTKTGIPRMRAVLECRMNDGTTELCRVVGKLSGGRGLIGVIMEHADGSRLTYEWPDLKNAVVE